MRYIRSIRSMRSMNIMSMSSAASGKASFFPREPIQALREVIATLGPEGQAARILSETKDLGLPQLGNVADTTVQTKTTATSPLSRFELLGCFATAKWKDDPTMPDFCEDLGYRLGMYQVATFQLTDAAGLVTPLISIVNEGDGDCNTGFWGCIFRYDDATLDQPDDPTLVAEVLSTGDTETTIRQGDTHAATAWFTPFPHLCFSEYRTFNDDDPVPYFSGLSPGTCETQLEKLLGVAVHAIMMSPAWTRLPAALQKIESK